jgi:hypothetical protein
MESVDGDDLGELLARNKSAFAVSDVVDWTDQVLDALNYLHTFHPPIFHKNVRPHNIKLTSAGRIKLLAFGLDGRDDARLSTALKEEAGDPPINYSPLELIWDGLDAASQKVIANSYDDRSEKLLKQPADARSDIYSLGATLYHLVTGKTPVDPLERSIELLDGNADPLEAPHKLDPKIPTEFSEVLMRALEIKRENRFDSAVIMRQVVRTAIARARERDEDADARELAEAAEAIRRAEQERQAKSVSVPEPTAELDQKQRQEQLAKQLREAEGQRKAEEQKKADELRKKEEAAAAAKRAEEEKAKAEAQARAQAEADAVLRELKQELLEIDEEPVSAAPDILEAEVLETSAAPGKSKSVEAAEVVAYNAPASSPDIELGGMFAAEATEKKGGMGMAVMAGIAGVIVVVAVAGWLLLSSGSSTPEPRATLPPPVAQIPATEPAQGSSAAPAAETSVPAPASEEPASQAPATTRQAARPEPAKAEKPKADPAKPAAEKKKSVTVDDLINDN